MGTARRGRKKFRVLGEEWWCRCASCLSSIASAPDHSSSRSLPISLLLLTGRMLPRTVALLSRRCCCAVQRRAIPPAAAAAWRPGSAEESRPSACCPLSAAPSRTFALSRLAAQQSSPASPGDADAERQQGSKSKTPHTTSAHAIEEAKRFDLAMVRTTRQQSSCALSMSFELSSTGQ